MFLDTARLGLMSPGAQRAEVDFARLAGREGASPRFERFLLAGFDDPADAHRFPGLAGWRGVRQLKERLRALAGGHPDLPVLLAARSANLMRLAARLLFLRCRNVLTADLGWPGYHTLLSSEAGRTNRIVTVVRLQDDILSGRVDEGDVVDRLRSEYVTRGCDGIFLPAVSSHGVRLPVEHLARVFEAIRKPRFVVIDGAQAYCHTPAELGAEFCDLYLSGCHKWLGGYHPMGLGFYGRPRSASLIETVLVHSLRDGELDDPLLRFTARLDAGELPAADETVSLTALFTCQAAAADATPACPQARQLFGVRLSNLVRAAEVAVESGWSPLLPAAPLQSGILLARVEAADARERTCRETRVGFAAQGVILTAYEGGVIRMSMPGRPWSDGELCHLSRALCQLAK